jgi:hypothetical protein
MQGLAAAHAAHRAPLLFGAWSLVSDQSAASDGALEDLLVSTLGFDLEVARGLARRRPPDALPPEPSQRILESGCRSESRGEWAAAVVDVLFHEHVDRLAWMADPRAREAHAPFWQCLRAEGVRDAGSEGDRGPCDRFTGTLWLPCVGPAELRLCVEATVGGLEIRTDVATRDEDARRSRVVLSGFLRLSKERGRPGATRIENQRIARFADERAARIGPRLLAHWLRLETFCLLVATP